MDFAIGGSWTGDWLDRQYICEEYCICDGVSRGTSLDSVWLTGCGIFDRISL